MFQHKQPRQPLPITQVLVLVHGSAVDVAWADASPRVGAILSAFYPGQMARSRLCCVSLDAIQVQGLGLPFSEPEMATHCRPNPIWPGIL